MTQERQGELYIGATAILWSLFPIITIASLASIGPLFSLSVTTFISSLFFIIVFVIKKQWKVFSDVAAIKDILLVTFFNGILFNVFFFIGLQYTSAGNAAIISLMEIFYTFLFFNVLRGETIPKLHIVGAVLMLVGASIIFLPDVIEGFSINAGDFIIFIGVAVAPIGNLFARRARERVSSESIMLIRSIISAPLILLLAFVLGENISFEALRDPIWYIVFNGFVLLGLSKIYWIEAIHIISVTKAISLSSIAPLFTLFFAYLFFKEMPTIIQITSFAPMFVGVLLLTRNNIQK